MFGWKPNSLAPRPILLLLCECSFGSWPGVRDFWFLNIFELHSNRQNLVQLLILTGGFTIRDNPAQCPSGELHCKVSELWYQMASLSRTCERVRDLNPFLLKNFIFPSMWSNRRSVKLWNFGQAPSWASSVLMMSWSTPKMWLEAGRFGHLRSRVPDQLERTWQKDSQIFTTFTYILFYCFCPRILHLQRQELRERMNHPWIVSVEK